MAEEFAITTKPKARSYAEGGEQGADLSEAVSLRQQAAAQQRRLLHQQKELWQLREQIQGAKVDRNLELKQVPDRCLQVG